MPDKLNSSFPSADPQSWLTTHGISEVECLVPDVNGVLRGKALPAAKFLKSLEDRALYLPSSAFLVAIDGRYSGSIDEGFAYQDPDMRMVPDLSTLSLAPGGRVGKAYVFADTFHMDGRPSMASPRHVLRAVLDLYRRRGWHAVTAPELEFYLTAPNPDPDRPLTAPVGRNGRPESVQHPYDMQALEEFEAVTRRLYEHAAAAGLPLDTLIHESGTAQLEINFLHGDPLALADKVLLFKRMARQAAQASGMHATFMAKPIAAQAGSSMHLHMSIIDEGGEPLFAGKDGEDTEMFAHFIGGLQKYVPEIMPLFAPNVNSYRRIRPGHSAPANIEWSHDNRSCGLRVPMGGRAARRVENRLPGADANPYLAMAGSLIAGYLGVEEKLARSPEAFGNAYRSQSTLPKTMEEALDRFAACEPVRVLLGEDFFQTYLRVKSVELDLFQTVVTSWERDHLLLKV
ncbi:MULTISPECIES: glutamine synthetase family protein [unclassified Mesorhizobium]|uniref:glutamine synthetase family protein n=1 Tax=unclassified Mesorhizobium TaxID=325217 RepID=UPI000FC9B16E|nr:MULTISPECIES: glutamine synthetase family protein [unclassified Mesorhizobium]RUV99898.1 glutamine synthetase [Mesorhizobium sp. M1A.F.Ca.IN.020.04.1.1]RUW07014.1 glutamine synthetase [Mesorhizobium sp. M1A.F.Ca.IN.020.03.1.1]RWF68029.1 MAG: glutamine synthetase [Mesorhizobium sp.]RWG10472.1 MAG: glutamine synthetase [Mesorhizobium sp.]RWG27698.1 MAG: glutamine synthetase [Mesorhizobium sp.]